MFVSLTHKAKCTRLQFLSLVSLKGQSTFCFALWEFLTFKNINALLNTYTVPKALCGIVWVIFAMQNIRQMKGYLKFIGTAFEMDFSELIGQIQFPILYDLCQSKL